MRGSPFFVMIEGIGPDGFLVDSIGTVYSLGFGSMSGGVRLQL